MNDRHENLFTQLQAYREDILLVLEGITAGQAEIVPDKFRNNIRWNMGHIYLDQYLWIEALTKEKLPVPEAFRTWFGYGSTPADFTEETPSFDELKDLLRQQPTCLRKAYGHRLEEEYPPTEMGMRTIEQVLIRTIFHEGMHLQAIMDIRKWL
ncbi:DinB family protein [Bacillus infantis]|uniref:DinB family protein n=1 Tax=Bacillus infantis TaxID=324767 RepID=UPI002006D61E|nr:DinB family protein [Bacillus infantis]MCK6208772.1 DinB family protein [Bacillus infantis]